MLDGDDLIVSVQRPMQKVIMILIRFVPYLFIPIGNLHAGNSTKEQPGFIFVPDGRKH